MNTTNFNYVSYTDLTIQVKGLVINKYNKLMNPLSSCYPTVNVTNQTFTSTASTWSITVNSTVSIFYFNFTSK